MRRLGYVPALDGLRGVGIAVVIGVHYFGYPSGGYFSMDMFFALSGFLITTLLLEEHDRAGGIGLRAFYGRRAYRLLPALFTMLAAYAILTGATPAALEQIAVGGLYAGNIVSASGSHLIYASPLAPLWSLAQEEQFYFIWPLLLVLLLRRRVCESRLALALGCFFLVLVLYRAGLTLAGAPWYRLYGGPDTHADGLVLGCLLALLRRRGFRVPQWAGWIALAAFVVSFAVAPPLPQLGAIPHGHQVAAIAYGLGPMSLAGMLLVAAAMEPGLLSRCFSFRPLVWLGVISYSLYLWHSVVIWLMDWQHPLVALPITLAVATLSYYKVERPLRRGFRTRPVARPETLSAPSQALSRGQAPRRSTKWALPEALATRLTGQ